MKSFKRRVVGVANLAEGLTPAEEIHGTFCIPIEECVLSSTIKVGTFCTLGCCSSFFFIDAVKAVLLKFVLI